MLSVSEAANILNVSTARVRALIDQDILPARKVGRVWALREEDVMQRAAAHVSAGRPRSHRIHGTEEPLSADANGDLRSLYEACKEAFAIRPSARTLAGAREPEEASFYIAVADFFLQEKQRELVERGVF